MFSPINPQLIKNTLDYVPALCGTNTCPYLNSIVIWNQYQHDNPGKSPQAMRDYFSTFSMHFHIEHFHIEFPFDSELDCQGESEFIIRQLCKFLDRFPFTPTYFRFASDIFPTNTYCGWESVEEISQYYSRNKIIPNSFSIQLEQDFKHLFSISRGDFQ